MPGGAGVRTGVFSTPVEVFLWHTVLRRRVLCLLHARGGVSGAAVGYWVADESSPRTWRCFSPLAITWLESSVFSTHVEVFPEKPRLRSGALCLLHARGGVSHRRLSAQNRNWSSPRTWRCFCPSYSGGRCASVFSTPVPFTLEPYPIPLPYRPAITPFVSYSHPV